MKIAKQKNFFKALVTVAFALIFPLGFAAPSEEQSNIAAAEAFIDAFYSFDSARLKLQLANATDATDRVLFYQGWAEGGNYKIIKRRACQATDDNQVSCSIQVEDDPMLALQIDFHVTDTFTITFDDGTIVNVVNSSNDLPIYFEAFEWASTTFPAIMTGPCKGFFAGGPTPADCARAITAAYKKFAEREEYKANINSVNFPNN